MRRFVCGDIHGNYKALKQCLQRSNFDYDKDELIQTGDVVDGFPDTYECVEELLKIKNLIHIRGNHDAWFVDFLTYGTHEWTQGALNTAFSYLKHADLPQAVEQVSDGIQWWNKVKINPVDIPESHQKFFKTQHLYYIDDNNNLFVHGGFNRHMEFKGQPEHVYYWDRDLWMAAMSYGTVNHSDSFGDRPIKFKMKTEFKEIFIGHTATTNWDEFEKENDDGLLHYVQHPRTTPMNAANIWNVDTGAGGRHGKLTFLNIETKEYFQSDLASELYPDVKPR